MQLFSPYLFTLALVKNEKAYTNDTTCSKFKKTIKFGSTTLIMFLLYLDIQKSFLIIIESAKITLIRNTISIRKEFS